MKSARRWEAKKRDGWKRFYSHHYELLFWDVAQRLLRDFWGFAWIYDGDGPELAIVPSALPLISKEPVVD